MTTIGPVNWGSYPGNLLEKVFAVLIGQDHPDVKSRTPSSGDGGVDIYLPEEEGWHVRQVKGFTGRLKSGQKSQIKESLERAIEDPRLPGPIVRWTLTVPMSFTSGEEAWFRNLVAGAPFPCDWEDSTVWDGLASRHPHVIDYYLRDGRERVEQRARTLLSVGQDLSSPLSPLDVAGYLEQLRRSMNRDDPHYVYDFATGPDQASVTPSPDRVVMAVTRLLEDETFLGISVRERYQGSSADAPITGQLTVRVVDAERGIDIRDAFESFQLFGTPLEFPDGSLDLAIAAPGGLGGSFEGGGGRIQGIPLSRAQEYTRLQVVGPDSEVVEEIVLKTQTVTRGELGGVEFNAQDGTGKMIVQFRVHPPETDTEEPRLMFNLQLLSLVGEVVKEAVPLARFASFLKPPYEMKWLARYGTTEFASTPLEEDLSFAPPNLVRFLEDLETIQEHVSATVLVPEDVDQQMFEQVEFIAELVRNGQVARTWEDFEIRIKDDVDPAKIYQLIGDEGAVATEQEWSLMLGDQELQLGPVNQVIRARMADSQGDDSRVIRLVPGSDKRLITTMGPLPRN